MEGKKIIRSIRFSEETVELIGRQLGDNFTQKFENLVRRCVWELPNKEKELEEIQGRIREAEKRLANLLAVTERLKEMERQIMWVVTSVEQIKDKADRAREMAEKL